ncbi:MAG TPA: response regulator [Nitrospirae bacterium]|nr:alginate biosynthesis transcriptional regulatory protein AlgB [bacterium BMS3Abin06]HDH11756.1 response regulator [Nitrospirota bacterium]HDZ02592.1 response regulator [Nitrospirota bacterium]
MEKGRILVLDDDPVITLSCKRILGAEGYSISTVEKGEDALNKLSKEDFDLLISDVRLPDINGMEVLKEARVIKPKTDVVIITGYPTLEDARESTKLGAAEYIEKPFTPDFMLNVAKKVFDTRGWILRQAFIDEFRDYVTPLRDRENPVIFYKEGTWARPTKEGLWEVGCDLRYWLLSGNLMYVEFIKNLDRLVAGQPFAKIYSSSGQGSELISPMNAELREINTKANDVMAALLKDHLSEGWLLWLARVFPLAAE